MVQAAISFLLAYIVIMFIGFVISVAMGVLGKGAGLSFERTMNASMNALKAGVIMTLLAFFPIAMTMDRDNILTSLIVIFSITSLLALLNTLGVFHSNKRSSDNNNDNESMKVDELTNEEYSRYQDITKHNRNRNLLLGKMKKYLYDLLPAKEGFELLNLTSSLNSLGWEPDSSDARRPECYEEYVPILRKEKPTVEPHLKKLNESVTKLRNKQESIAEELFLDPNIALKAINASQRKIMAELFYDLPKSEEHKTALKEHSSCKILSNHVLEDILKKDPNVFGILLDGLSENNIQKKAQELSDVTLQYRLCKFKYHYLAERYASYDKHIEIPKTSEYEQAFSRIFSQEMKIMKILPDNYDQAIDVISKVATHAKNRSRLEDFYKKRVKENEFISQQDSAQSKSDTGGTTSDKKTNLQKMIQNSVDNHRQEGTIKNKQFIEKFKKEFYVNYIPALLNCLDDNKIVSKISLSLKNRQNNNISDSGGAFSVDLRAELDGLEEFKEGEFHFPRELFDLFQQEWVASPEIQVRIKELQMNNIEVNFNLVKTNDKSVQTIMIMNIVYSPES